MGKRLATIGDATTTGGRVINGKQNFTIMGKQVALQGDMATCPDCKKGIGPIIEGAGNWLVEGIPVAYDGCIIACGCPTGTNRIIASQSIVTVDVQTFGQSSRARATTQISTATSSHTATNQSKGNYPLFSAVASERQYSEEELCRLNIRQDVQALIDCAEDLSEKHLYYPDIKSDFIHDVRQFAAEIVHDVDSGHKSYEQGRDELKEEEQSLLQQSWQWGLRGLEVLGGIGLGMTGVALCTTGAGCIIGSYLIAHGASNIYQGVTGESSILKEMYQKGAKQLGFSQYVGDIAYDLVDLGLSIHGKLKLIPKLNEFGEPVKKLYYYGRQDLERAYTQMNKWLLDAEIFSDMMSLYSIVKDIKNVLILDKATQETSIVISEPEKVTNVGEIMDSCQLVIRITFSHEKEPAYYLCTRPDGTTYESVIESGSQP